MLFNSLEFLVFFPIVVTFYFLLSYKYRWILLLIYFNIFYQVPSYQYLLPVGISFYTFQTLGYTIDVYRGTIAPEYHFGRFALFVFLFNLFLTFLISGIWHGANRTFVIWGALHGFYMVAAIRMRNIRLNTNRLLGLNENQKLNRFLSVLITFTLVNFAWIFFRANNLKEAFIIIQNMFRFSMADINLYYYPADLYLAFLSLLILIGVEIGLEYQKSPVLVHTIKRPIKLAIVMSILFDIVVLGKWDSVDFLYFQF
jgi:D-alanyl-lipoteichoic acid acyltransferase DltB (MBOAT superfamily)